MQNMPGMQHDAPPPAGWQWIQGANAFFGFNYQQRKFRDFHAWESQNWIMTEGTHRLAGGTFRVTSMESLEPFTLQKIGSPQVFQTGETFHKAPLIDYQHPHDLFMGLGADYTRTSGNMTYLIGLDAVGSPTLGPTPFMHRPSAFGNPEAPLSHHNLDSTHLTPGVVRGGVMRKKFGIEGSWFRGEEPDERRTDLDLGALDSYAMRLSWTSGPWAAQASGARLHLPEAITPYDADRLTGSVAYTNAAYLFEATIKASVRGMVYTRAESVDKDILDAGFHPRGVFHRHRHSQVGALTVGYQYDLLQTKAGTFAVGGDVTGYTVPLNLQDSYGSPSSYHLFIHYSLGAVAMSGMMHH
jgi:hypothetical protein